MWFESSIPATDKEQTVRVQINDRYNTTMTLPYNLLSQKSTLFKNLQECTLNSNQDQDKDKNNIVQLKLEHPEKFKDLVDYIETGEIRGDLMDDFNICNYISDVNYLGIEELQPHLQSMFYNIFAGSKFKLFRMPTTSGVYYAFIEKFLHDKCHKPLPSVKKYNLMMFVLQWGTNYGLSIENLQQLVKRNFNTDWLTRQLCQDFHQRFPSGFGQVISSQLLMERFIQRDRY